jgi:DNA-binding transcriptional ArsR family regulator
MTKGGQGKWGILQTMLEKNRRSLAPQQTAHALVFAALGDETRLSLIAKLSRGQPCSISRLTENSQLTRQAITKHLRVLELAGIVRNVRKGRESLFEYESEPIEKAKQYLELVSEQWDRMLTRLKSFVEE